MAECIQAIKVYYSTVEGFVTSDPPLLNLRHMAKHIEREHGLYGGSISMNLSMKNGKACVDTLMNGHWEELIGKLEELLYATDHPDDYCRHIQLIIEWSSDGQQRLESFLRPHVIKYVQGVIKAMSSSSASGCALAFVDLHQQLVDKAKAWWIPEWMGRSIVDEAFVEVLSDHPDLRHVAKAQVSVLCQSFK